MTRYLAATKGHLGCAVKLYEINIQVSQTLYGVLHGYEVTLRNAIHNRLREHFGRDEWYQQANLSRFHTEKVQEALDEVGRSHATASGIPVGKVVAELNLGFWTGLIAPFYEQSLWQPCLRKAFPNAKIYRWQAYRVLSDIRSVRNRVAHHERILGSNGTRYAGLHPIHRTELTLRPEAILECVAWICSDTSAWIRSTTKFDNCLNLLNSNAVKNIRF